MNVTIKRNQSTDQGTTGLLTLEKGFVCDTLELPDKQNQPNLSCIPEGTYQALWLFSNHFHMFLYHLQNVPNREDILIHAGNFAGDISKNFKSDVEGCILLGKNTGTIYNQTALLNSRDALLEFHEITNQENLTISIGK